MGYLDKNGLVHVWEKIKLALSAKQDALAGQPGQMVGFGEDGAAAAYDAVPVASGGTGAKAAGEAVMNLLSPLQTRNGTYYANMRFPYYYERDGDEPGAHYVPFTSIQTWTINRTNAVNQANTSYNYYIARGIALISAAPASVINGGVCFVYS